MNESVVAIVDDGSSFSTYLRGFLSARGYGTRAYPRSDDLLAAIRQGDAPGIVLLDVMTPGMAGLATLRALKTSRADLQVIMMSGREQVSIIVEAVRLGAADYVVKPDGPDGPGEVALEAAIQSAIQKAQLVSEITTLRRHMHDEQDQALLFLGGNTEIQTIAQVIEQVSDSDVTVLIRGESGVGKELVARAIHERSSRKDRPFIRVNCAALPDDLLESELFGHEKGAFTGAATMRLGKFEQADTGTIVLDEIGEMKAGLQAKLLHVLQGGQFSRLGSNKSVNVDVRVVAATNRNLEEMMRRGTFREDLYYRLKVIEVTVPPLRERRDEIPHLTNTFMDRYAHRYKRPRNQLSPELQERFLTYGWPGNIRELENMVKRMVILQDEQVVFRELSRSMPPAAADRDVADSDADEIEATDDIQTTSTTTTVTAPTPTPTPTPVVATAIVQITNTPSPAPYSGLPINDAASCKGSPNTWFYTQTLKESGGAAVTFTSRIDTFDQRVVNNTANLSLVVPAMGSLDIASRWCSSEAVTHTAQSSFAGTDANGHAIKVDGPVITLKSP